MPVLQVGSGWRGQPDCLVLRLLPPVAPRYTHSCRCRSPWADPTAAVVKQALAASAPPPKPPALLQVRHSGPLGQRTCWVDSTPSPLPPQAPVRAAPPPAAAVGAARRGAEGYLNVAALAGLDSRRDTTSYLHRFAGDFEEEDEDDDYCVPHKAPRKALQKQRPAAAASASAPKASMPPAPAPASAAPAAAAPVKSAPAAAAPVPAAKAVKRPRKSVAAAGGGGGSVAAAEVASAVAQPLSLPVAGLKRKRGSVAAAASAAPESLPDAAESVAAAVVAAPAGGSKGRRRKGLGGAAT